MFRFLNVILLLLFITAPLKADPVEWKVADGGNGHWYEVVTVDGGILWADAKTAAESLGGYLATVMSVEENTFIYGLAALIPEAWDSSGINTLGPWLGGSDAETEGTWKWITGESFSAYSNWGAGQPNGNGDYLNIYGYSNSIGANWNDFSDLVPSYLVEYGESQAIPEPSFAALLLIGGALAMFRKRGAA